jgi:hypothetical protein
MSSEPVEKGGEVSRFLRLGGGPVQGDFHVRGCPDVWRELRTADIRAAGDASRLKVGIEANCTQFLHRHCR